VEGEGLVLLVDHWQANAAAQGFVEEFSVLLPPVQRGQRVEFALDGPVGANDGVRPVHEPDAHDLL
jgi:hypothetical protein